MPGSEAHAKVVQSTTGFHHAVTEVSFPVTDFVFDDPKSLDAPNSVFNTDTDTRNLLVDLFLLLGECTIAGFLLGLDN